jgi:hypothetical protein
MTELLKETVKVRGEKYTVREMKGTERYKCIDIQEKEGNAGMAGFILKRCIVEPAKVDWDNLPTQVVEKLVTTVMRLSDLGDKALEDAEKKSEGTSNS